MNQLLDYNDALSAALTAVPQIGNLAVSAGLATQTFGTAATGSFRGAQQIGLSQFQLTSAGIFGVNILPGIISGISALIQGDIKKAVASVVGSAIGAVVGNLILP